MEQQLKPGKLLKQHMIDEIASRLKGAESMFVSDCGSLTNKQMEELRGRLKKASSDCLVVKNSMCIKALEKIGLEKIQPLINGTCALAIGSEDAIATSKVLVNFVKENEKFQLKGAYLDEEIVSVDIVKQLAAIPSREVLLGRLLSSLNSPISGMAGVLSGIVKKLLYALNAIVDKKQK